MSSTKIFQERTLRRANDCFASGGVMPPRLLFDEFWREGEVALLFGPHGVGKSLLAVEIAEALARGRPIEGLEMPNRHRRNVLYVDLVLSETQFGYRYSCEGPRTRRQYKFSTNLYRDCPLEGEDLVEWLRVVVEKEKISVVIIDDLSVISRTDDGTRQTLELVRELRRMTRQLGISALVLADSHPYIFDREIAERDLRRTRILCAYADSVFALSAVQNTAWRHLVQTRSQAGDLAWTHRSPAHFKLAARDDGFVGFGFIEVELTDEQREMICKIREMRVGGRQIKPFRCIADKLGISKSTAARLYGKWRPAFEQPVAPPAKVQPVVDANEFEHEDDEQIDREDLEKYDFSPDPDVDEDGSHEEVQPEFDPHRTPFAAALARRSIYDLERDRDHNGNEIFVESREEHSGKPKVWYQRRPRGEDFAKFTRDSFGISGKTIGPSPYLPRDRKIATAVPSRAPPGK